MGYSDEFFTLWTKWRIDATCYLCFHLCMFCDELWFWIVYFLHMTILVCVHAICITIIYVYLLIIYSEDGNDSILILYLNLFRIFWSFIIFIIWLSSISRCWQLSNHCFNTYTTLLNIFCADSSTCCYC